MTGFGIQCWNSVDLMFFTKGKCDIRDINVLKTQSNACVLGNEVDTWNYLSLLSKGSLPPA